MTLLLALLILIILAAGLMSLYAPLFDDEGRVLEGQLTRLLALILAVVAGAGLIGATVIIATWS